MPDDIQNDGGPAFPNSIRPGLGGSAGISTRDYFAAKADVSIYAPAETFEAKNGRKPTIGELAEYIASIRYVEADAMLAERSRE